MRYSLYCRSMCNCVQFNFMQCTYLKIHLCIELQAKMLCLDQRLFNYTYSRTYCRRQCIRIIDSDFLPDFLRQFSMLCALFPSASQCHHMYEYILYMINTRGGEGWSLVDLRNLSSYFIFQIYAKKILPEPAGNQLPSYQNLHKSYHPKKTAEF